MGYGDHVYSSRLYRGRRQMPDGTDFPFDVPDLWAWGAFGTDQQLSGRWLENGDKLTLRDRIWRHGINDMVLIFLAEYLFGSLLRLYQICPWDYSGCLFNVDGVIRLDFAPYWFFAGLLFETLTGGFRKT